jgi:hypothetical protein
MEISIHQSVHGYNSDLTAQERQLAYLPWYETVIPVLKWSKMDKNSVNCQILAAATSCCG